MHFAFQFTICLHIEIFVLDISHVYAKKVKQACNKNVQKLFVIAIFVIFSDVLSIHIGILQQLFR